MGVHAIRRRFTRIYGTKSGQEMRFRWSLSPPMVDGYCRMNGQMPATAGHHFLAASTIDGQTSTGAGYTDACTGKTILRVDWSQCKTSLATSLCVAFITSCFCAAPSAAASSVTWFLFIYFLRRSFRFLDDKWPISHGTGKGSSDWYFLNGRVWKTARFSMQSARANIIKTCDLLN